MIGPTGMLIEGGRLHLQHGPIDLVIGVDGAHRDAAFHAAAARFDTVLQELVDEIDLLRRPATRHSMHPKGDVAQRMYVATQPHNEVFVTFMAAVAGAVADEVLKAMVDVAHLTRAYVNNGGDIALHLTGDARYVSAFATPDGRDLGRIEIYAHDNVRGIATSGQGGRSHSMGVADSVTVLAHNAAMADVAATLIANAVDLPEHPNISRVAADEINPDSDLGARLIVRRVGVLTGTEISTALDAGRSVAQDMMDKNLIHGAALYLRGDVRIIGAIDARIDNERVQYA